MIAELDNINSIINKEKDEFKEITKDGPITAERAKELTAAKEQELIARDIKNHIEIGENNIAYAILRGEWKVTVGIHPKRRFNSVCPKVVKHFESLGYRVCVGENEICIQWWD